MTVVALPLVNEWTQDRDHAARRTPRWRGITLFHELRRRACMSRRQTLENLQLCAVLFWGLFCAEPLKPNSL